jgi:hypothetical protein
MPGKRVQFDEESWVALDLVRSRPGSQRLRLR